MKDEIKKLIAEGKTDEQIKDIMAEDGIQEDFPNSIKAEEAPTDEAERGKELRKIRKLLKRNAQSLADIIKHEYIKEFFDEPVHEVPYWVNRDDMKNVFLKTLIKEIKSYG